MTVERRYRLTGADVTLELLEALATLAPYEREAWIDVHLVGLPSGSHSRRSVASLANRKLREYFGSAQAIRDAA